MALGETKAAGMVRWASFIRHFNLKNVSVTVIFNEYGDEVEKEVAKPAPIAIKPKLSDFLLALHQSFAHQGLGTTLLRKKPLNLG